MRLSPLGRIAVVAGAGALALPFLGAAASASAAEPVVVPGAQPVWATPAAAVGAPSATSRVSFSLSIPLRDAAGADAFTAAVSTPGSASFHKYLTPAQYNARFGPSSTAARKVSSYLKGQGFAVTSVADGNAWVTASGTVAQVQKAFGTQLKTYRYKGKTLRAPATAVHVPASIRGSVTGITGLDQGASLRHPFSHRIIPGGAHASAAGPKAAAPTPSQCSTYWAQHSQTVPPAYGGQDSYPTYICGYVPDQLQSAYGVKRAAAHGRTGHGVTVAIIDAYASPTMRSDANTYSRLTGGPTFTKGQFTQTVFKPFRNQTACGGEAGWNGEETLDVESVHGVASGAKIHYVGAYDCDQGIDVALNYTVQHHVADMVSNSYGNLGEDIPASEIAKEHRIFNQAVAEGIGMYFSSGDSGDEVANTGSSQPDYPAVDPKVTAVGGTSLAVGADGSRLFETGWGSDVDFVNADYTGYDQPLPGFFYAGAGGGTSSIFTQPAYQKGVVPASLSKAYGNRAMRVIPDVAAVADPFTGFLIGETVNGTYTLSAIGGTSLACPTFVGVQAISSQGLASSIGFANPALYNLRSKAFHDVAPTRTPVAVANPSGSYLVTFDRDSTLATAHGYDNVTGLGTPNGDSFIYAEGHVR